MKEQWFTWFKGIIAVAGTSMSALLGGWDVALTTLATFMVGDYITGIFASIKSRGQLNSEVMFWGGLRKGAVLFVILIAVKLDMLVVNDQPLFRTLAIYYYVAREGLSILENMGKLGVKYPSFLGDALEQLDRSKSEIQQEIKEKEEKRRHHK